MSAGFGAPCRTFKRVKCSREADVLDCGLVGDLSPTLAEERRLVVAEIGMSLLLAAHLLCVNVAAGGPMVAAWLDWRGMRGSELAARGAVFLGRAAVMGLLLGAMLGVLVGWLKWTPEYESLWLGPLSYKLKWTMLEAVFSLLMLAGWCWFLPGRAGGGKWAAVVRSIVAVLAATNLMYHFPVLFSIAGRLQDAGETTGAILRGGEFRALIGKETIGLGVHVALASIAVAGVLLLVWARQLLARGDKEHAELVARWGGRWALVPTLVQLPLGLYLLSIMPAAEQARLMGGSGLGVLLFVAALGAAFWLMNDLAQIAMGEVTRGLLTRAVAAMVVTVGLMTAMQMQTREQGDLEQKVTKETKKERIEL
jgi:hypothetical protein